MDDPTIVITSEFTKNIARYHNLELLKKTLVCGGVLSTDILEVACLSTTKDRLEKLKFILDNKIEPTETAFLNVIDSAENMSYYNRGSRYNRGDTNQSSETMLNLLTDYGYAVTYDNLKTALKKSLTIKNIERFDIKFDSTYLHICSEVGMYPYKTKDISPDITCLINECKKAGNLAHIKKVIAVNNLTPDSDCMREACKHRNNLQTIKYLVSKGGRIDSECMKNIIATMRNRNLSYIFDEFNTYNTVTLKDTKDIANASGKQKVPPSSKKAVKYASSSDESDESDDSNSSEESVEMDSENSNDSVDSEERITKKTLNKKPAPKQAKKAKSVCSESEEDIKSEESIKSNKSSKSSKSIKSNIVNSTINSQMSTPVSASSSTINKVNFVKVETKIPADFTCTESVFNKLSPAMKKTLKITPKNTSLNYIDFRKLILEYHKNNDLIVENKITLKSPFLYNGANTVEFNAINEWIYSILITNETTGKVTGKGTKGASAVGKTTAAKTTNKPISKSNKKAKDVIIDDDEEDESDQQISTIHDVASEEDITDTESNQSAKNRKQRRATASKGKTPIKTIGVKKTAPNTKSVATKTVATKTVVKKAAPTKTTTKVTKKYVANDSDESDESNESEDVKPIKKIPPKKATAAKVVGKK